jgi:hypothetical protein
MADPKSSNAPMPPPGQPDTAPVDAVAFARTNSIIRRVVEQCAEPEALHCYLALVDLGTEQLRLLFNLNDNEKAWREANASAVLSWRASVILIMREEMAEVRANGLSEQEIAEEMLHYEECQWASFPRNSKPPSGVLLT